MHHATVNLCSNSQQGAARALVAIFAAAICSVAEADYIVAKRSMNVYSSAATSSDVVGQTEKDDVLIIISSNQQNGYYKVSTPSGVDGYVYRTVGRPVSGDPLAEEDRDEVSQEGGASSDLKSADCQRHLLYGTPSRADQIICRQGYVVGYSYDNKIPDWVTYTITGAQYLKKAGDRVSFREDTSIPSEYRSKKKDYSGSGYATGHLASNQAMDYSVTTLRESFFYSNAAPQLQAFNGAVKGERRGIWRSIEELERKWACTYGHLVVYMGVYVPERHESIGNGVAIPEAFFRVVVDIAEMDVIAFWMPQSQDKGRNVEAYMVTVDEVEAKTGLDLMRSLESGIEDRIESKKAEALWSVDC